MARRDRTETRGLERGRSKGSRLAGFVLLAGALLVTVAGLITAIQLQQSAGPGAQPVVAPIPIGPAPPRIVADTTAVLPTVPEPGALPAIEPEAGADPAGSSTPEALPPRAE